MPAGRPVAPAILTPDELAEIGRAIFGDRWQAPLGRALDLNDRSIRRLADGTSPVHEALARRLLAVARQRRDGARAAATMLAAKLPRSPVLKQR